MTAFEQRKINKLEAENAWLKKAITKAIDKMDCPAVSNQGEWQTGMFCGLEDRSINDRYEACLYGYEQAIARVQEWVIDDIQETLKPTSS